MQKYNDLFGWETHTSNTRPSFMWVIFLPIFQSVNEIKDLNK